MKLASSFATALFAALIACSDSTDTSESFDCCLNGSYFDCSSQEEMSTCNLNDGASKCSRNSSKDSSCKK